MISGMHAERTMIRTLKIYPALLRAYWQRTLVYRAVFLVWIVNAAFPLVMMSIWVGLSQGSPIAGYSAADFVGYYLGAILVRRITGCGIVYDLENLVRTGELSVHLLRPMGVVHHFVARVLTARVINVPLLAVPVAIGVLLTPGAQFNLSPANLLVFGLACVVGFAFEFLSQYLIGGLSFWTTQAHGVQAAFNLAKSFLGGYIVPLALFPAGLQRLLQLLPFQSVVALPVEVLTGRVGPAEALPRLLVCTLWVVVIGLGARLLWRSGVRSYSAVGA
jgi:ABC-2 type transport system permease protein